MLKDQEIVQQSIELHAQSVSLAAQSVVAKTTLVRRRLKFHHATEPLLTGMPDAMAKGRNWTRNGPVLVQFHPSFGPVSSPLSRLHAPENSPL